MKNLVVIIFLHFLFISTGISYSQWFQTNRYDGGYINCLAASGTNIFANVAGGTTFGGIYLSTNNGINWAQVLNSTVNPGVNSLVCNGADIFAATIIGVYFSTNNGTNWIKLSNNSVFSISVNGNNIFSGIWGDGVYHSTNYGTSWTKAGLSDNYVTALAVNGNDIYAGTAERDVFLSTDYGTSWIQVNNGLPIWPFNQVNSLAVTRTNIFAATNGGVYLSTNKGTNWTLSGLNEYTNSLVMMDSTIFAGANTGGVYLSTNNGINWTQCGLNILNVLSLAISGTNIYAGTNKGIFLSTNKGSIWTQIGIPDVITPVELTSFTANSNNGIANLSWNTATETNNRGFEIQRKSSQYNFITVAFVNGKGTSTRPNDYSWSEKIPPGIYSYRLKQVDYNGKSEYSKPVEVSVTPENITLAQNYPNPFNPSTVISYSVPLASNVKLIAYNTLGQTVKVLENGFKNAGNYSVNYDAADLPSGIYFYKLEAGQFSQVKKMMLLK
jgi:hypothetical protein